MLTTLPPLDAALSSVELPRFALVGSNNMVNVNVKNEGSTEITDLTINWNDGTDHIANIPTSILPGATATVSHPTTFTEPSVVEKNILVSITEVNGGLDGNLANNSGSTLFNTISQSPPRNVVMEEGTGTWCTWCPAGIVALEEMLTNFPNDLIGVAVHSGDPMEVTGYGGYFSSFPSFDIDRVFQGVSATTYALENYFLQRQAIEAPATVGGTYSVSGTALSVNATSEFWTNLSSIDYRLAVVVVEDSVTGTSSDYDQANGYSGGAFGTVGGYELLPNPVPSSQMVYDHVARKLLGGYAGQNFSVPTSVTDGQMVSYSYNITLGAEINTDNLHAYAILLYHSTGEIINAGPLQKVLTVAEEANDIELLVYPNPADENFNVQFTAAGEKYEINITDLQGRNVSTMTLEESYVLQHHTVDVSALAPGNYMLSVASSNGSFSQMVTVK
ncbi:MAG: Omp28-related outer membrane protein [Crocinitomicaceae bacterium]|nr:Omp28-related outer membrane protein [Crocinitomicaceae bacterium]